jgi:HrpA-like RNA helicase
VAEPELPNPEELEERREKHFSRRVALTTAIYAVVLAIASLGGNNAMKEMLLAQQQSSDQWAFYQAKVIREHQYRGLKLQLEAQLAEPSTLKGAERAKLEALAARFAEEEKRYNAEKKDIEKDAKKLERERDHHRSRDPYFDFAEVFLQIAIVTASVAILSTSRPMFWFSLVLAVIGAILTANGFTQLFRLPFLHGSAGH